jgi:putative hydrolases of HD superfamily
MESVEKIVDFLFEAGILAKTPRSGFHFLGTGEQSVAEHINRATYIGFALAQMNDKVDANKVVTMCLFHDFTETRISDLGYVHQKYNERQEEKALNDFTADLPFGEKIRELVNEYETRESMESLLVKDADILELVLSLKEVLDAGNEKARAWIGPAVKRLKTKEGQQLAEKIVETDSDHWWFSNKEDDWWVNRNKSK